jgi:hypothetical protein
MALVPVRSRWSRPSRSGMLQMWARSQKRGKAGAFQTTRNTQPGFRRDGQAGGNGTRRRSVREIRTHAHTGRDSSVDPRVHVAA